MIMIVWLRVLVTTILRIAFGQVVVVIVEKSLQKKHRQKPAQRPDHQLIDRMHLQHRVRYQMKQRHTQHEARDKTDGYLQALMCEPNNHWQPATRQGSHEHESAISGEQPSYGIHAPSMIKRVGKCVQPEAQPHSSTCPFPCPLKLLTFARPGV